MKTLAEQSMKPCEPPQPGGELEGQVNASIKQLRSPPASNINNNTASKPKQQIDLIDISGQQQQQARQNLNQKVPHQQANGNPLNRSYLTTEENQNQSQKSTTTNKNSQQPLVNSKANNIQNSHNGTNGGVGKLEQASENSSSINKFLRDGEQELKEPRELSSGPETVEASQEAKLAESLSLSSSSSPPPKVTGAVAEPVQKKESQQPQQQQQERQEIGLAKKVTVDCLLYLIKGIMATFDLITRPIYYFKQDVGRRTREVDHLRSVKFNPEDPNSPWRQIDIAPHQVEIERRIDSYETYDAMMRDSFNENAKYLSYGYRQVLEETWSKRADNPEKLIRRVRLSDYKWCTYGQFELQIEAARRGLLRDGVRAGQRVIIFADTRPEWQICSQALIRLGAIVGTMYSTLGIDGIVHTVNETQATLIIAQGDKVGRLLKLANKLPKLKKIIYFEPSLFLPQQLGGTCPEDEATFYQAAEREFNARKVCGVDLGPGPLPLDCMNFCKLVANGLDISKQEQELKELEVENQRVMESLGPDARKKDSLAVIMYTSGSTGIPKGVLISHGNIMATVKSFSYVTKDFINNPKENTCTAYLPLAHIFEFCIESVMLYHGVKFGFASPHTLTDKSPGLAPGERGDLAKLTPTVMIIVPLILDRIVQGVKQALKGQSYFKEQFVSHLIDYKSYWQKRHYETPLVDKIVCSKMSTALGGKARFVICGSAPLSSQTQTFVRSALNLKLPQGFGTTETCAATCCQLFDDQSTANVGLPVSGAQIKLEPWIEGNYRPDDKPNPRGEIVVGGQMIAHGYYNLEEQTREAFYVDEAGTRWYRTGDIGEMLPNGQLKIIDRKKDLVKLQNGEYISLGRVESTLKSNPYTENFCVYANSNFNYVVALGPANELAIKSLAQQIIDESERKLSPSMMRRLGGSQQNLSSDGSVTPTSGNVSPARPPAQSRSEETQTLLMSEDDRQLALEELKEVLATYESDLLNNNNIDSQTLERRRSSAISTESNSLQATKPRADSGVPPPLAQCMNERLNRLCENKLILERVLAYITRLARERNLMSLEVPKKLMLLAEEWTEDKNLVTAAMKIRRNYIYKRYERELEQIYNV